MPAATRPTPRLRRRAGRRTVPPANTTWYKDAIIYELHVRSFQDGNGDGIGDFTGLTRRLPHLHDLGVTAVWLLPFYPSPLRDDGYDIADYLGVHPDYGTLDDFRRFLDRAHDLGLRVITELVLNHTSDQHPWFRRARTASPGSPERDFYVWSDSPDQYSGARVIFADFERSNWSWDPVAGAYYWHRFYSHQPDLNFDNPAVFAALQDVLDHWFRLGVDGMRLDAVPYLVEREGTHSENLEATHAIIKRLRAHVDRHFQDRMFIAEANQWPEDAVAYFGEGDESHMVFHFPLMPRLFLAIRQEDCLPIVDILVQTPPVPPDCQWALFLRNHDELTLEMVTEEERLYMYDVYAADTAARVNLGIRRRLAPLLRNDRRRIELMNALLFSLPGTPVIYYGDEIGMGDNIHLGDRHGVRTPMQWSGDRNAGFSEANPQRLFLPLVIDDEYHHQSVHVAQQLTNPHSLLSWMKRLIATRKRYQAFGRGDLTFVGTTNRRILAFVRRWHDQRMLVVTNLSRFVQHVPLDLADCAGTVPVEVFGRTPFPPIAGEAYDLTLAPHTCLWFELTPAGAGGRTSAVPRLRVPSYEGLFTAQGRRDLASVLPAYIERSTAWNAGSRTVIGVDIDDAIAVGSGADRRWLTVLHVTFASGEPERYLLPLGVRAAPRARPRHRSDIVAELVLPGGPPRRYELFDAAEDPVLAASVVRHDASPAQLEGITGTLHIVVRDREAVSRAMALSPSSMRRSRRGSNALLSMGGGVVLKLFRQLETGPHPEIEMRARLREIGFAHTPPLVAGLRWEGREGSRPAGLWTGILQDFVENDGEAWSQAVAAARTYFRRVRSLPAPALPCILPDAPAAAASAAALDDLIGPYRDGVERLARRVAELHTALATPTSDPAFAPEPSTVFSRRSAYQRMRGSAVMLFELLHARTPVLSEDTRDLAGAVLRHSEPILASLRSMLECPLTAIRIRCHGNLHLGQILCAGTDLVIIDFDGEPGRPLYERRLKRSPLHDVATLVRSFHYAAHVALARERPDGSPRAGHLGAWMRAWQWRVGSLFVAAYAASLGDGLLPADRQETDLLLRLSLLDRAIYECRFELDRGSKRVAAPLADIPRLLSC